MISGHDKTILRTLAQEYLDITQQEDQQAKRQLWSAHNSLKHTPIPIYVRAFAWHEMPQSKCQCEDAFFHPFETNFRQAIFRAGFGDDFIFEPWLTVSSVYVTPFEENWGGIWGLPVKWISSANGPGAKTWDPPLKDPEDFKRLIEPHHVIDEVKTAANVARIQDVLHDVIPVVLDRAPLYRMWNGDIATQLGQIRGIEQLMWDMLDRPAWLHQVLAFMRDGILATHSEAEAAGDWRLCNHENQSIPYSEELPNPSATSETVTRAQLWYYCAAQELTAISPAMHDEFMLQYQIPILKHFGLVAYGCCEDLTNKINILRQIPNLRRIAVSPFANVARCAEQIGRDYVLSYRPSPADMVAYGFDVDRIRSILKRDLTACKDCHVDITLKDVETVEHDPDRVKNWVKLTRDVIDEVYS